MVCVLGFLKVMIYKGFLVYFVSISGLIKITWISKNYTEFKSGSAQTVKIMTPPKL